MGYPFPDTKGTIHEFDQEAYDEARLVWRRSLSDVLVRALATDYRLGKTTEENYDAYQEYYFRKLDLADKDDRARKLQEAKVARKNRR